MFIMRDKEDKLRGGLRLFRAIARPRPVSPVSPINLD